MGEEDTERLSDSSIGAFTGLRAGRMVQGNYVRSAAAGLMAVSEAISGRR